MSEPIGNFCPRCGHPPRILVSPVQAFCGNDDCPVFSWDPTVTPAEFEATARTISLEGIYGE